MRNPNSFGSIVKLSGKRRKPWAVRITVGWEYESGKAKQQRKYLGYYETRKEAMQALAEYNADPYDIDSRKITTGECFEMYMQQYSSEMSKDTLMSAKYARKYIEPIESIPISQLKTEHIEDLLKGIVNDNKSNTTVNRILKLIRYAVRYALQHDYIRRDITAGMHIPRAEQREAIHMPFTREEVRMLWDNINIIAETTRGAFPSSATILIMTYTGMRPSELRTLRKENVFIDEKYIRTGSKTKAGKNRIIPIHDDIYPLVKEMYNNSDDYFYGFRGKPVDRMFFQQKIFDEALNKLSIRHLPHDCRHTFITRAKECDIDTFYVQRIVGHATRSVTENVYTQAAAYKLLEAVNQISFV